MRVVDTHCHLQDAKFDEDREAVIARALEVLDWIVVIGETPDWNEAALAMVRPCVYAVVGCHPYHAKDFDDTQLARLREQAARPGVVALGEMGLDYYNEFSPRADQQRAFRRQLELACELGLPVVIHNRDADADMAPFLEEFAGKLPGGVLHCFGSDAGFARHCVALGYHVSFAGNVTFPKAKSLRDAATAVPMDRLLVETDAPYLAPQPRRGKRCEPADVLHTAEAVAVVKGVPLPEFADQTTANACRLFGVTAPER